jgi:hypothetical protein
VPSFFEITSAMVATSPSPPAVEHDAPPAYDSTGQPGGLVINLEAQPSSQELLISLLPPAQPKHDREKMAGRRAPLDLCLVIDVSGSMNAEAPVPGEQGKYIVCYCGLFSSNTCLLDKNETTGLSVLDVVKHATRTIIESMSDDDRIAIVTFSDSAQVCMNKLCGYGVSYYSR